MVTASLDMGAEKMVMALASVEGASCRLLGIKIVGSQGMERGLLKDKEKARACVRTLASELIKDREVDVMNIALPGEALQIFERRISLPIQRKSVESGDLERALQRCREEVLDDRDELIEVIPVAYSIDRGELVADPLGRQGRHLEVTYQVYVAHENYLDEVRSLFDGCNLGDIYFYPAVKAYTEALAVSLSKDFALVDMGASGINVILFRDGMLEYEARLPLGTHTIDTDIMLAFGINGSQARKLKHEYGQALRSNCKNKKIPIPDTKLTLESRDLSTVVQSRAEELLEGVAFLLQKWGFDNPEDEILLTGGGSRLQDVELLLGRFSGHPVGRAVAKGIQTTREEVLRTPEYLVVLGLLFCKPPVEGKIEGGWSEKIKKTFGQIFGI